MQSTLKLRNGYRSQPPKERTEASNYHPARLSGRAPESPVYLYVVYSKGHAKIGITENPKTRVSGMQSGNPFPIEMLYSVPLPRAMATDAEIAAMRLLNDAHWFGDWFKASRSHARFAAQSAVDQVQRAGPAPEPPPNPSPKYPGMRRRVLGPGNQVFVSCAKAAAFLGVSRQAMSMRLQKRWKGWRWEGA